MENIILTGDRPTGNLHLGHYVGSLINRVKLQNSKKYDEIYIMIADAQALTDNFSNPKKVRDNVLEIALDYLSVGIDPNLVNIFIQSEVSELTELTFYYMNLVNLNRLKRNPTIKSEIVQRGFEKSIPVGFLNYPISQTADITAFKANVIPVGVDQLPMIEQAREIVKSFNSIYKEVLVEPTAIIPDNDYAKRLPGIDGMAKMSKSLGNCIYLKDEPDDIKRKVMQMYTDPNHIRVEDPGEVQGNVVFIYLEVFATDELIKKYAPEYNNLEEIKDHYKRGGLGDVYIKKLLNNILQETLAPIRERRAYYEKNIELVYDILEKGTKKARKKASETLKEVKSAMMIDYFSTDDFKNEMVAKYQDKC